MGVHHNDIVATEEKVINGFSIVLEYHADGCVSWRAHE